MRTKKVIDAWINIDFHLELNNFLFVDFFPQALDLLERKNTRLNLLAQLLIVFKLCQLHEKLVHGNIFCLANGQLSDYPNTHGSFTWDDFGVRSHQVALDICRLYFEQDMTVRLIDDLYESVGFTH